MTLASSENEVEAAAMLLQSEDEIHFGSSLRRDFGLAKKDPISIKASSNVTLFRSLTEKKITKVSSGGPYQQGHIYLFPISITIYFRKAYSSPSSASIFTFDHNVFSPSHWKFSCDPCDLSTFDLLSLYSLQQPQLRFKMTNIAQQLQFRITVLGLQFLKNAVC